MLECYRKPHKLEVTRNTSSLSEALVRFRAIGSTHTLLVTIPSNVSLPLVSDFPIGKCLIINSCSKMTTI